MQFPSRGWGDPLGVDAWDGGGGGGGLGVVERTKEPPWLEKKRAVEFTFPFPYRDINIYIFNYTLKTGNIDFECDA